MEGVGRLSESPSQSASASRNEQGDKSHRLRRGQGRQELHSRIDALEKQRRYLAISSIVLALGCIALVAGLISRESLRRDALVTSADQLNRLEGQIRASNSDLASAQQQLKQTQERVNALVAQRIPGLRALELYRTIDIHERLVRDITFNRLESADRRGLEYKVVVENTSSSPTKLGLAMQFFDAVGVQLGGSELLGMQGGKVEMLRSGEIRSYFGVFGTEVLGTPAYFRLAAAD